MIIVRITMEALLEKRTEMLQTLLSMIGPAGKEKECLSYEVFCSPKDNHIFSLIEEWETRKDLDRHLRSERFSVLLGTKSLLASAHPQIKLGDLRVSNPEMSPAMAGLQDQGNQGITRRRTTVRRTSDPAD